MIVGLTVKGREVLGSFGKGTAGSVTLNFATSGGANCDTACAYHPNSTNPNASAADARCYAAATERRHDRVQLLAKLERHEATDADILIASATAEMERRKWRAPWFRFSSFGSVPATVPASMMAFLIRLRENGIPVHFPVESAAKADRYRTALSGTGVAIRESVTDLDRWTSVSTPMSVVAGSMQQSPRERISVAKAMAADRTKATGRKCIVCPAVAAMHLRTKSDKAKCGSCTACANSDLDIVYPVHK